MIPNADLFTHSVIVNTASDVRRSEYDLSIKSVSDISEIKSRIVNAVRQVPGTLPDPSPEALVLELTDDSGSLKVRVLWWTKAPRQHQMLASYDAVLTAIRQALSQSDEKQGDVKPGADKRAA